MLSNYFLEYLNENNYLFYMKCSDYIRAIRDALVVPGSNKLPTKTTNISKKDLLIHLSVNKMYSKIIVASRIQRLLPFPFLTPPPLVPADELCGTWLLDSAEARLP